MCADAELQKLDDYAARFVADMRDKVSLWGMGMFLSDKQELFLMTIASKGLQYDQARRARPNWIKRAEGEQ